jgi:hypothetical protein
MRITQVQSNAYTDDEFPDTNEIRMRGRKGVRGERDAFWHRSSREAAAARLSSSNSLSRTVARQRLLPP